MRGGAECYVMRYLVAMISTLRSPLPVTLFSLTLIGLLSKSVLHRVESGVSVHTTDPRTCMAPQV